MTEVSKESMPKKWTEEEEKKLLDLVKQKKNDDEIAKELERSVGGPIIRRRRIAVRMVNDGKPHSEVCEVCGISEEELEKHNDFDKKNEKKKQKLRLLLLEL